MRPYNWSRHASEEKPHRILNLDHLDSSRSTLKPSQRDLNPRIREMWPPWAHFRRADWVCGLVVVLCWRCVARGTVDGKLCPALCYNSLTLDGRLCPALCYTSLTSDGKLCPPLWYTSLTLDGKLCPALYYPSLSCARHCVILHSR